MFENSITPKVLDINALKHNYNHKRLVQRSFMTKKIDFFQAEASSTAAGWHQVLRRRQLPLCHGADVRHKLLSQPNVPC